MIIDQRVAELKHPNLKFDQIEEGAISPFSNKFTQYTLVHRLASQFDRLSSPKDPAQVLEIQHAIDAWAAELPAELARSNPDISKDSTYPWIPLQRSQLHSFVQMVRFTPVRQFILQPISHMSASDRHEMRPKAVTAALNCVESALHLLHILPGVQTRFHFVLFVLFDTTAAICSAVIQDHAEKKDLPQRERLLRTIALAIDGLETLPPANDSTIGAVNFLKWLVARMPVSAEEAPLLHRRSAPSSVGRGSRAEEMVSLSLLAPRAAISALNGSAPLQSARSQNAEVTGSTPDNTADWETMLDMDLGVMDEIWDYTSLNLPEDMNWGKYSGGKSFGEVERG